MKQQLYDYCQSYIVSNLDEIKNNLLLMQESANNETKSSMGDKYETGRAMLQLEKDKLEAQKEKYLSFQQTLSLISTNTTKEVQFGSVATTSMGVFFLSIGIGKKTINGTEYFLVGIQAPLVKEMLGLKKGDSFKFNNQTIKILNVE